MAIEFTQTQKTGNFVTLKPILLPNMTLYYNGITTGLCSYEKQAGSRGAC